MGLYIMCLFVCFFSHLGPCRDDDMISLASMMSVSNLSTIGFLEDEEDDYYWSVRFMFDSSVCTCTIYTLLPL